MRLAALLILLALPAAAQTRFTPEEGRLLQDGLTATAEGFIVPAYEGWTDATEALSDRTAAYCDGDGELDAPRAAYRAAFLAWQRASTIQMGPITAAEGPKRVQLWPDPKGFSRRAVVMAGRAEEPAVVAPGGLEGRSIALVNLEALEQLLFTELEPGSYRCALADAIARYQRDLSSDILAAWQPGGAFRTDYDTALSGNDRYGTVDDLLRELLSGLTVHIDQLRRDRIERGLGTEPGDTHPERTEAVSSALGLASIETAFRALSDLYLLPGGLFDISTQISGTAEHVFLGQIAGGIADDLAAEDRSLAEIAEEDGEAAADLRAAGALTLYHEDYLKTGLPGAIGLVAGFSAADGD